MTVDFIVRSGDILIHLKPEEYDVLVQAMMLYDWSAIGAEKDDKKLRLIEQMREDLRRINPSSL